MGAEVNSGALSPEQPFVGPRPFETADRELFFGRARETHEISSLIPAAKYVVLYATSGAGKTSLFNAGVVPLIDEELEILHAARFGLPVTGEGADLRNVYTYAVLSGWL